MKKIQNTLIRVREQNLSNLHLVAYIANKIGHLKNELVFVGGSIVELLLDKDYPVSPRPTKDVDAIVGICNRKDFNDIEKKLRKLGFKNNITDGVICESGGGLK